MSRYLGQVLQVAVRYCLRNLGNLITRAVLQMNPPVAKHRATSVSPLSMYILHGYKLNFPVADM